MTPKPSKTALLIAAMATAVTLTSFGPASAKAYWVSAEAENAEVVPANFKIKVKKHHGHKHHAHKHHGHKYHGHKHHGYKHHAPKKKHLSKHDKAKALILKKLF